MKVLERARQRPCWAWPRRKAKLDRFNELAMNYSDETADEMAAASGSRSTPNNLWDLDSPDRRLDGGAALPARRRRCQIDSLRRRTTPGGALQTAA